MRECRLTIPLLIAGLLLGGCKSTKLEPREVETTCLKVHVYGCRHCDSHSAPLSGVTVLVDSSGTVSEKATDTEGNVCFSVKTGTTADIVVTSGEGTAGNRLPVSTDTVARDPADCTNCPS